MTDDIKVIVENEVIEVGVISREVTVVTTASQGPQGPPGPQGLQGPMGPPSQTVGGTYTHQQIAPATVWVVNHNLGFKPNVRSVDSAGTEHIGDVDDIDQNSLTITFTLAFGGEAYCS